MSTPTLPPEPEAGAGDRRTTKRSGRASPFAAVLGAVSPPLDLRILGRTLLHTALVGFVAGLIGAGFFAGLEHTQAFLLERVAGYTPLRAHGEKIVGEAGALTIRPLVMLFLPAAGAFFAGLVCLIAPETRGGGGDAM